MQTTKKKSDQKDKVVDLNSKKRGALDRILNRNKAKKTDPETTARTFADTVVEADEMLQNLITTKTNDLQNETGDEEYNNKAVALLRSMEFHVEEIARLTQSYADLRDN